MHSRELIRKLVEASDLNDTFVPGVMITEITDNDRIIIENHCGIIHYSPDCICVKTKFGQLQIEGDHLEIARMSADQFVIAGEIQLIKLIRGR